MKRNLLISFFCLLCRTRTFSRISSVRDTIAAGNYLRREMASYTETEGEIAEPTVTLRITVSSVKKFLNKNYNL